MVLESLASYTPFILILGGIVAISWLLEKLARPAPVVGQPISLLMKVVSLFGFFVGILLLATAVGAWSTPSVDSGTRYLLIASGLALLLKPLRDVPWAALLGLIVGIVCVGLVYLLFPLPEAVLGISSTWVYALIFFIPALLAYMLFKFLEDLLRLIGMILASKPVATILGLLCIVQGILLIFGVSLFAIISL